MTTNSESYEMKQIMRRVAACLSAPMHQMGGQCAWYPGAWTDKVIPRLVDDSMWRASGSHDGRPPMAIYMRDQSGKTLYSGHHKDYHCSGVYFSNPRYSEESHIWRSPIRQLEEIEVNVDEKSKVFTNFTDDVVNISYEELLTLTDSYEKSTSSEWHFDVSETVKIGGEVYGVSVSSSTTASGGESGGTNSSKGESTEKSVGVSINFELQPGEVVRVHTLYHQSRTQQDYDTHAVLDFDMEMKFTHWPRDEHQAKLRNGDQHVHVKGVAGMAELINNRDTDYPNMGGLQKVSRLKNCMNSIMSADKRTYHIKGTEESTIQDNEDFKLEQLQHDDLPPGVPVIDMSMEEHQQRYGA